MSLTYRPIKNEKKFAKQIWLAEETFPAAFKAASKCWTPTYKSFRKWWNNATEIFGLFDDDKLKAVVYAEIEGDSVNIHVSVLERFDKRFTENDMIRFWKSLVRQKQAEGITNMRAWILGKNRFLLNLAYKTEFCETGLKMYFGSYKNKVLEWREFVYVR